MSDTRPQGTWTTDAPRTARPVDEDQTAEIPAVPREHRSRPRTAPRRATLRKVDPWSVLKLSLIFYFCLLVVVMFALIVFWAAVNRLGMVDGLLEALDRVQVNVTINAGMVARAIFLLGLLNVLLWTGVNVFLAFLYNLTADLVGGLRVMLSDDE